jgi:hypothetical protein
MGVLWLDAVRGASLTFPQPGTVELASHMTLTGDRIET